MKEVPVVIAFPQVIKLAARNLRTGAPASPQVPPLSIEWRDRSCGRYWMKEKAGAGGWSKIKGGPMTTVRRCPRKQGWYCKKHDTTPMKTGLTTPFLSRCKHVFSPAVLLGNANVASASANAIAGLL